MKKILITGFEPFGGDDYNPSGEIARALEGYEYNGFTFVSSLLPVNRFLCIERVEEALRFHQPEIAIALGLAGSRSRISVERVAINVADFPIPDNAGYLAKSETLIPGAPDGYFSKLPIKRIVQRLKSENIPSEISNTAGTYCCNTVMYTLLHLLQTGGSLKKAGFIHIPLEKRQITGKNVDLPWMVWEMMLKAVRLAAEVSIDFDEDTPEIRSGEVC